MTKNTIYIIKYSFSNKSQQKKQKIQQNIPFPEVTFLLPHNKVHASTSVHEEICNLFFESQISLTKW